MLILRVWREGDEELRARITETQDVASQEQTNLTAAGVEPICEIVCGWLERVARGDAPVTKP
jgi:hypothetical protein